jgi:predicted RNA binding protein YcfA (HicA-like mRNA interferase family)
VVYRPQRHEPSGPLEEALANADSYLRLSERRYASCLGDFVDGLREYLKSEAFPSQGPGYSHAVNYLRKQEFDDGLATLLTSIRDAHDQFHSRDDWKLFREAIRAAFPLREFVLLSPVGWKPFPGGPVRPLSSREVVRALEGLNWQVVPGGKGSHVKMAPPDTSVRVTIPHGREHVSMPVLKSLAGPLGVRGVSNVIDMLKPP